MENDSGIKPIGMNGNDNIIFTLVYNGEDQLVQTRRDQYHTLMALISDRLAIPGFGLCCGMGSCGSCLVDILEKNAGAKTSTLSCGLQVNDSLANTTVIIAAPGY